MTLRLAAFLLCLLLAPAAAAEDEPRLFTPVELRADFAALYDGLREAAYDLYANTSREELDRAHAEQLAALDRPMTQSEAAIAFQTFVSRAHIAHARVDFPEPLWAAHRDGGGRIFPLELRIIDGRVYVAADNSGLAEPAAGDEIVGLNGQAMSAWLQRLSRHISADSPYMAGSLLEFWAPKLLWVELGEADSFDLTVRKRAGGEARVRVPARSRADILAAAEAQPKVFELDAYAREHRILDGGVGYLKPGPFYNMEGPDTWDATAFRAFIDQAFKAFIAAKVEDLVIDLRQNPGGDNSFSDPMVAWFADRPFRFFSEFRVRVSAQAVAANQARVDTESGGADSISHRYARLYAAARPGEVVAFDMPWAQPREDRRFRGRVHLLVDRHSYSNSVTVAALVQDFGFARVMGEKTSDLATTYGAMEQFTLPATGIVVGFPKAHIIRPNGDPQPDGVTPDVAIASPIVPAASDVVLEQALGVIRAERSAGR